MTQPRRGIGTTIVVVAVIVVLVVATMAFVVLSLQTSTPPHGTSLDTSSVSSSSSSPSPASSTCASYSLVATTSTNESAVFNLQTMPSNFTVGDYRFVMVYNGTGYGYTSNGSPMVNLGYNLVFNITQGSETQTVMFGSAPPAPYPPGVPSPSTATAFDGNVHMQWVATCTAIFFEVDAQPGVVTGTNIDGLQLTAAFSPVVAQGSNVTVSAQVYNTLPTEVEVNATSMANPAYGPCQQRFATGVDVYQGDYSAANLTQGTELLLYNPVLIYTCPEVFTFQYSFAPNSDNATVEQIPGGQTTTGPVSEMSTLAGYWTGSGQNYTFPVGNYTLVVFDAWGQTAVGHFAVDLRDGTTSNTSSGASTTDSALVEQCPDTSPGSGFGTVIAGTGSPALICVQLYYYSATPLTVNLTAALSIQALQYVFNGSVGTPRSFSGASNFTVSVSQSQLTIGGPNDENEGTVVAYAVAAKAGASGTYQLGFLPSSSLDTWMLGAQEPEQCGYYGQLVSGDGQPNYVQPTGCITYTTTNESSSSATTSSSAPTIPGIPYQLIRGDLYFRIVGVASSIG
jgi:hypothetical protein